jgi:hypothetical protein
MVIRSAQVARRHLVAALIDQLRTSLASSELSTRLV